LSSIEAEPVFPCQFVLNEITFWLKH